MLLKMGDIVIKMGENCFISIEMERETNYICHIHRNSPGKGDIQPES